jgi:hypothetical protein
MVSSKSPAVRKTLSRFDEKSQMHDTP